MIKTTSFRKTHFLGLILITLFACGKTNEFSLTEERDKILALHHLQRDYHFNKDSIAFANQFTDDFVSVNKGVIAHPSKEETITRYNGYFSSVEFVKWDDLSEPIIKFSDDGSMAYTIVDKIVSVTFQDANGETQSGETHFAWTAIYEKHGDNWKIAAVTSTEVPSN